MSEQNISAMRRWFEEVWNQGRLETVDELMAPDAIGIGQGGPEVAIHGPAEFRTFAQRLRSAFPDIHVTVQDAFGSDDKVAIRWSATMTHQGSELGIPASGKPVRITGISVVRFANSQIVEGWDNWDQLAMLRQIGAIQESNVALTSTST